MDPIALINERNTLLKNNTDTDSANQTRAFNVGIICPGDDTPGWDFMPISACIVIDGALADRIRLLSEEVRRLGLFFVADEFDQTPSYEFANDEERSFTCDSVMLNVYKDKFCLDGYASHSGVRFETKEILVTDLNGLTLASSPSSSRISRSRQTP